MTPTLAWSYFKLQIRKEYGYVAAEQMIRFTVNGEVIYLRRFTACRAAFMDQQNVNFRLFLFR